jgi:hypothetical protein
MLNGLQYNQGEIDVGIVKTSLIVDDKLWQDFSIIVIKKEGNRKKNDVMVELIKEYVKKNGGMQK